MGDRSRIARSLLASATPSPWSSHNPGRPHRSAGLSGSIVGPSSLGLAIVKSPGRNGATANAAANAGRRRGHLRGQLDGHSRMLSHRIGIARVPAESQGQAQGRRGQHRRSRRCARRWRLPRFSGGRRPSSIAFNSLFPIIQAAMPRSPQQTMLSIPRTRIVVAWLCSGYGLWAGTVMRISPSLILSMSLELRSMPGLSGVPRPFLRCVPG